MKIASYDITLDSSRQFSGLHETYSGVTGIVSNSSRGFGSDSIDISSNAREIYYSSKFFESDITTEIKSSGSSSENFEQNQVIERIISHVSGLDVSVQQSKKFDSVQAANFTPKREFFSNQSSVTFEFTQTERVELNEKTHFGSSGVVKTEDGREISFGMHLQMRTSFFASKSTSSEVSMDNLIDPLVIQFDGGAPALSDNFFSFDLNGDGTEEQMRSLGQGSGFLALDINHDGKINDGTELFGPNSGNGFQDLAVYDDDQNGWIDENDEIYSQLSVWRPETDGEDEYLSGLKSANVGAIYLGYSATSHSITDDKGNSLAQLKSTGMFLKESGEAGYVYEMDMADLTSRKVVEEEGASVRKPEAAVTGKIEKPNYIISLRDKIADFLESMERNEKRKVHSAGIMFDDLMDRIRNRLTSLMDMIEGEVESKSKLKESYKSLPVKNRHGLNFSI